MARKTFKTTKKTPSKNPKNLYEILEVNPRARPEIIKAAYRVLIGNYHPDKSKNNTWIAKDLNYAKGILLDENKRAKYDHERNNLIGNIVGNYRILELIAEGGFGSTYRGESIELETPVCIKHGHYVSPQDERILVEEAKAIWDLRHYGIPAMRDYLKLEDGSPALVMSYVPGPTLEQVVEKTGGLDAEDTCWITERVINVLKYLHYNGVIHGDVKPQNIIIQPESHNVVLVDYGLSLIRPDSTNGSKGYTPYFASPEQIRGDVLLPESDFYSLGMTMIYALGGDIKSRKVPEDTPNSICKFIKKNLVHNVLSRPAWHKGDVFEDFRELRKKTFGRAHSGMKPIKGLK